MADSLDIVTSAVQDAYPEGGSDADTGTTGAETTAPDSGAAESPEVPAETGSEQPEAPAQETDPQDALDDFDKELNEYGIQPKNAKNGRVNWIPYPKVKNTLKNAHKKWEAAHAPVTKEHTDKIASLDRELVNYRNAERLATEDPDRYIQLLAAHLPDKYSRFVGQNGQKQPDKAADPYADMPGPDTPDGYSPKGLRDLLAWNETRVLAQVTKENERKFEPILKERQARLIHDAEAPKVQARIQYQRELWGTEPGENGSAAVALIDKYEKDILNEMAGGLPFEAAIGKVLVPKLNERVEKAKLTQDQVRGKVIEELNGRPAAAERSPAASSGARQPVGTKSAEDVVKEQMRAAGLK